MADGAWSAQADFSMGSSSALRIIQCAELPNYTTCRSVHAVPNCCDGRTGQDSEMLFKGPARLRWRWAKKVSSNVKSFKFSNTSKDEVNKIISDLKTNKSETENDIPAKIIKQYP